MKYKNIYILILTLINFSCQENKILLYQDLFNYQLKPWTSTYSNFKLTDFKLERKVKFDNNNKQDFNTLNSFYATYKPILTFSKDSSSFIDIYSNGLNLTKKGEIYEAFPDIDQSIFLCDIKSKYWDRICFGTPGFYYEDVFWIDNTKFILLANGNNGKFERTPSMVFGDKNTQELIYYKNVNSSCIQKKPYYKSEKLSKLKIVGM